jgi:hypothetical protein
MMAGQWGNNTLGPGQIASWFFVRGRSAGFLPVLSVIPLSPSFTTDNSAHYREDLDAMSLPTYRELGVSTIWSQLSNDGANLTYFMTVMNFSNNAIQYAFVEADV